MLPVFEGVMKQSYWTSQTSLSEGKWVAVSTVPTQDKIMGCCCHRRSQANTVPEEPPAFNYYEIREAT